MDKQSEAYCPVEPEKPETGNNETDDEINNGDVQGSGIWTFLVFLVVLILISLSVVLGYSIFFNKQSVNTSTLPLITPTGTTAKPSPTATVIQEKDWQSELDKLKVDDFNQELQSIGNDIKQL